MTISTYAELKTAIANYTHRSDLTGYDDEFIDSVEAKLNRRLRIRAMEASSSGSFVAGTSTISLPTDFLEVRDFICNPSGTIVRKLEFVTPEQASALEYSTNALPKYFTFAVGAIRMYPTPDSAYTYTLRYYAKVPALSGSQTTNTIITNYPDAYLYGCLIEACAFTGDDPRLPLWKEGFEEVVAEIINNDSRERFQEPAVQFDREVLGRGARYNVMSDTY